MMMIVIITIGVNDYEAVIMTTVISRGHCRLRSESAYRLLPSTSTIAICYYYSARKLILTLPFRKR